MSLNSAASALQEATMLSSGWYVVHATYDVPPSAWSALRMEQRLDAAAECESLLLPNAPSAPRRLVTYYSRGEAAFGLLAMDPSAIRLEGLRRRLRAIGPGTLVAPASALHSVTSIERGGWSLENYRAELIKQGHDSSTTSFAQQITDYERIRSEKLRKANEPDIPSYLNIVVIPLTQRRSGDDNWLALADDERQAVVAACLHEIGVAQANVDPYFTRTVGLSACDLVLTVWGRRPGDIAAFLKQAMNTEYFARYLDAGPVTSGIVMSPREILELCGLV